MKTFETSPIDKSKFTHDDWAVEPDYKKWFDEATGLPCTIKRNVFYCYCGYVGVLSGHPLYGQDVDAINHLFDEQKISIHHGIPLMHDGITFAGSLAVLQEDGKITASEKESVDGEVIWWFGFHCFDLWDRLPFANISDADINAEFMFELARKEFEDMVYSGSYKDFKYVMAEVQKLAAVLGDMTKGLTNG